jgi:hypothetical protein
VTDGTYIWVVNDTTRDRVFRYTLAGALLNSWAINSANSTPTGITLDPSNGSQDIWIVDSGTDRVYRYANARTLTAPTLTSFFQLAAGNTSPSGIADPPAGEAFAQFEVFVDGSLDIQRDAAFFTAVPVENLPKTQAVDTVFAHRSETLATLPRENSDIRNFVSAMKSVDTHRMKMLEIVSSQSVNGSKNRSARAKSTIASESDLRDQVFADLRSDWK